jgi:hypothetical protein
VRTPPRDYSTLSLPSFLSLIILFFSSLYLFIEKEEKRIKEKPHFSSSSKLQTKKQRPFL